jgi:hypothetical protein
MGTVRAWIRVSGVAASLACAGALASAGAGAADPVVFTLGGTVGTPAVYTASELRALPQTTAQVTRPRFGTTTVTGVLLETLVKASNPVLPAAKNALLRVTVNLLGGGGSETVALGELDPNFGNHPAIVALTVDGAPLFGGPEVVIPADTTDARTIYPVKRVTVGVQNPAAVIPDPGALEVEHDGRATILPASVLASLPAQTLAVAFMGPGGLQHHTETGPTLATVLAAARVHPLRDTWVAGVGSDDYVATVTPAEATVGGRPLLVSTREDGVDLDRPRLVADGDVKGGRYVSDMVDLVVGEGDRPMAACALVQPGCPVFPPAR